MGGAGPGGPWTQGAPGCPAAIVKEDTVNMKQARARYRRAVAAHKSMYHICEPMAFSFRAYARWMCAGEGFNPVGKLALICKKSVVV